MTKINSFFSMEIYFTEFGSNVNLFDHITLLTVGKLTIDYGDVKYT